MSGDVSCGYVAASRPFPPFPFIADPGARCAGNATHSLSNSWPLIFSDQLSNHSFILKEMNTQYKSDGTEKVGAKRTEVSLDPDSSSLSHRYRGCSCFRRARSHSRAHRTLISVYSLANCSKMSAQIRRHLGRPLTTTSDLS